MGVGIFWSTVATGALILAVVWLVPRIWGQRKPRDLSDTLADRVRQVVSRHEVGGAPVFGVPLEVWNLDGRHSAAGDVWPQHDPDADEDGCWCRGCFEVAIELMQDVEIRDLFAGLVDTPELRDLADRVERGLR